MTKREKIKEGVALMGEAIEIRRDINEIYKQYRALSNTACFAAGTNPHEGIAEADLAKLKTELHEAFTFVHKEA